MRDDPLGVCATGGNSPANSHLWRYDGIGIEEEFHAQIFEPLRRLHGRSQYPGNGMGLAIARRLAERLGGSLEVESALGRGTRFLLRLPRSA